MSENLTAEELADLKAKALKAGADIVGFEINPVHESEKPPGLMTELFNVWAECRNRDGSTDVSRYASGMLREDAEYVFAARPDVVLSLLTALEEAKSGLHGVMEAGRQEIALLRARAEKAEQMAEDKEQHTTVVQALRRRNDDLDAELRLWRSMVTETPGVPRYVVTPGAALNSLVTSTDRLLRGAALSPNKSEADQ